MTDKTALRNLNSARRMKTARLVLSGTNIGDADLALISPSLTGLPEGDLSVFAMLPIHAANGWLDDIGVSLFRRDCGGVPAVFAADPLLDVTRLLMRLSTGGFRELAIWPSVGILDREPDFAPEGLDFPREVKLAQLSSAAGFAVTASVFNASHVQQMVNAGAARLILHPPLAEPDLSGDDLAGWLNSLFPDGAPDGIEMYLYSASEDARRTCFHPFIDGILTGGTARAIQKFGKHSKRVRDSWPVRPVTASILPFLTRRRRTIIVGASIGSGAAAHAVANGGADFVVALNAVASG